MSREIKFRAWDVRNRKMIADIQDQYDSNRESVGLASCESFGGFLDEAKYKTPLCHVMQYTGLKDKNGTEIYEGDIVRDWEGIDIYEVRWNNVWACFELERQTSRNDTTIEICDMPHSCEVIGNIYENPELLEQMTCPNCGGEGNVFTDEEILDGCDECDGSGEIVVVAR